MMIHSEVVRHGSLATFLKVASLRIGNQKERGNKEPRREGVSIQHSIPNSILQARGVARVAKSLSSIRNPNPHVRFIFHISHSIQFIWWLPQTISEYSFLIIPSLQDTFISRCPSNSNPPSFTHIIHMDPSPPKHFPFLFTCINQVETTQRASSLLILSGFPSLASVGAFVLCISRYSVGVFERMF